MNSYGYGYCAFGVLNCTSCYPRSTYNSRYDSYSDYGDYELADWEKELLKPAVPKLTFAKSQPKIELNKECKLPQVGDIVYLHETEGLPVGSLLKLDNGRLYVRSAKYNSQSRFLMSLDGDEPKYLWGKFTIVSLGEWQKDFKVGDVLTHAQAQTLPVNTVLVYAPDEWSKRNLGNTSGLGSHWFVTNKVVSARCGVIQPMTGTDHWTANYKIVYMP